MRILAIETSCDETGISIIETEKTTPFEEVKVLANTLLSQASLHAEYGGIFPSLARREHSKNIIPLLVQALTSAGLAHPLPSPRILEEKEEDTLALILKKEMRLSAMFHSDILALETPPIDAIAVTKGPGLEPALWVGINTAQALGALWNVPIIPINHMEGHIVVALLTPFTPKTYRLTPLVYPSLALLISGGHTELVLARGMGDYEILGQTRDDAVGEAFDKVARMLGLPYPGGPEISKLAETAPVAKIPPYPLPRPMLKTDDFDFSFAGLKTAVLYTLKNIINPTQEDKASIAKEFEDSVTEILITKTLNAAVEYKVKEIILGGGVTANKKIREAFQKMVADKLPDVKLFIPARDLSTDNALMIGIAGLIRFNETANDIVAEGHLRLAERIDVNF
ncbi:MAG: tRNA (adenosine(37)-N6)-threonylcarbamoyltransferase complex transferase subunit TsaD [Candidatus Yonathbacteria bacterium]|nr:tRNA (adenosine(37)-N6)-threonylcarbamoyltransferase complex transferase subunit TsaD [Candidatus Yonathbacteria bacterium]